ncbi:MAG: penicillin-binding protein 2 [Betaproteobacteria bacterium]|nr:penicillin-binding protein 2 [Betaproteobacteria bacterium]
MHSTEFRNPEKESRRFRGRLMVALGVVVVAFGVLAARFAYLQILRHDYYHTRAEDNRIALVPIAPTRGLILDRNGVVLARNYSAYTLEITPSKAPDLEALIDELATLVDIQPKDRRRFRRLMEETRNFESLPIRNRLTDEEVARFVANRYRFPGVEVKARLFRQYPQGTLASHVLGYIGRVTDRDLARIETEEQSANYRGTEVFGKSGLEQKYEFVLHGETGYEEVEVDAGGRAARSLARSPARQGTDLVLTLDLKLQEVAEKAFGERRGALVAIDPGSGGILAMVSMPGFDPNLFVDGIDPASWDALNNSPDRPMINRALNGAYPPGSTFKPFMALGALEQGKRTPQQAISDPGFFWFGGHKFRDDKVGGHGLVDMYASIVHSCDTYYYTLGHDMGIDNIARFMAQFGFGSPTGVDLEGESRGVLPSSAWKLKRFRQKWYAGETISVAIGQGYNAYTPMQLAHAVATLASGGVVYRPHLVQQVGSGRDGERVAVKSGPARSIGLDARNVEVIRRAMVGVNKEGTGARAFAGVPYSVAGKTGTAQVVAMKQNEKYVESRVRQEHRDHALYIAFAPAEAPRIALAVLVENGGFGARSAAPIARQMLDYYLLGKLTDAPAREIRVPEDEPVAPRGADNDEAPGVRDD